jgi:hypothetical protein
MNPTIPKPGTQTRRILDMLLEANGAWVQNSELFASCS